MKFSIKEIVKDNEVHFDHYRVGHLYYNVLVRGVCYLFPVPLNDTGKATFLAKDKALLFMRYIRKAIEEKTFVKSV